MMVHSDIYSLSAKYYDEVFGTKEYLVDVDFYVDLAWKIGGPVLELACGTGRVLLPIARQARCPAEKSGARAQGRPGTGLRARRRHPELSFQCEVSAGDHSVWAASLHVHPDRSGCRA